LLLALVLVLTCGVSVRGSAAADDASGGAGPSTSGGALSTVHSVAANGAYQSSVEVAVPKAPGAPQVALVYDSEAAGGVAGVGWDLSVELPTTIARDTRFGTPDWAFDNRWVWGSSPLVSADANGCGQQSGPCHYRTARDTLASVTINVRGGTPSATVMLPGGTELGYGPVRYDGKTYPKAPPGAATDVFGFVLQQATDANGYVTCYRHTHHGDVSRGRAATLAEITYGPKVQNCSSLPPATDRHRVTFSYSTLEAGSYAVPWSMRLGAPVSVGDLLRRVTVAALGAEQYELGLTYDPATATETRRPRLRRIDETTIPGGSPSNAVTRALRWFDYGSRRDQYDTPQVLDLGEVAADFPSSLSGAVTRPIRQPYVFSNPNGVFQRGNDQLDENAPPSHATTEQWSMTDLNGDGLIDTQWGRETGFGASPWPTFEASVPSSAAPAQQLAIINEGVTTTAMATSRKVIDSRPAATPATSLATQYSPLSAGASGYTPWLWSEGRGETRAGLSTSITTPEISTTDCPPTAPGEDTRKWPIFPDGSLGGSQASIAEKAGSASSFVFGKDIDINAVTTLIKGLRAPVIPRQAVSATLSGWQDLTGDGVPDFVVTPSMIHRFDKPGSCLWAARTPSPASVKAGTVDTDWHLGRAASTGGAAVGLSPLARTNGPSGPEGMPLNYSVSWGNAEGFGFTIPVGSVASATVNALATKGVSLAADLPGLVGESFAPRSESGQQVTGPSPSVIGTLLGLVVTELNNPANTSNFVTSTFTPTLDVVIQSAASKGRTQSRGQLMDVNADGLPDYVLYDSDGGDLLVYLNTGSGGFGAPRIANTGFDYPSRPDTAQLAYLAGEATKHASESALATPPCRDTPNTPPASAVLKLALCTALAIPIANQSSTVGATGDAVRDFLTASPDTLPTDRARLSELDATREGIFAVSGVSGLVLGPNGPNEAVQFAEQLVRLTERTVRQLDYRSRINMLSKGFSDLDGATIGKPADGTSVQTAGFVDLNGDALPDYVITKDRDSPCQPEQWQVYWGTGTSALGAGRLVTPTPTCLAVPAAPPEVVARGYPTLPLSVDMVRRAPAGAVPNVVDTATQAYVTLHDHNQDGRPDLLLAGDVTTPWDPAATTRTWTIYRNSGSGFDLAAPLTVSSPTASLPDVEPASPYASSLAVPYPSLETSHAEASLTKARDRTDHHAGFLDADGDGNIDIVRRVLHSPTTVNGEKRWRAGLLVWSRAGTGPQDLLVEERRPVEGARLLVQYKPGAAFQWKDGAPDGSPPADGHYSQAAVAGQLVRSVTVEPLMGRPAQRVRTGYDYRKPFFDVDTRLPTGFAVRSTQPLDPVTGAPFADGVVTTQEDPQRAQAGPQATRTRETTREGALIRETLSSYVEYETVKATSTGRGVFAAPTRTMTVEYPEGLRDPPIFDVGFDGRDPLVDRAHRSRPVSEGTPAFSPAAPTGGALVFAGTSSGFLSYPSPHIAGNASSGTVDAFTLEAWLAPAVATGERTVLHQPGAYTASVNSAGNAQLTVQTPAGTRTVAGGKLPIERWSHLAAVYGGGWMRRRQDGAHLLLRRGPGRGPRLRHRLAGARAGHRPPE